MNCKCPQHAEIIDLYPESLGAGVYAGLIDGMLVVAAGVRKHVKSKCTGCGTVFITEAVFPLELDGGTAGGA